MDRRTRISLAAGLALTLAGCSVTTPTKPTGSPAPSQATASPEQASAAATAAPTTEPSTVPVTNGRIAFRRYLDAGHHAGDIFTINPDGTALQQVTRSPANGVSTEPSWSPDGEWIVYMVAPDGDLGRARLAKIRADGTDAIDLSGSCTGPCRSDGFPAFDPSGQLIAFERKFEIASGDGESIAIFVMDADGTNVRQITQQGCCSERASRYDDTAPTFAPGGAGIAFERTDLETYHHAIFTVGLDGTDQAQVTDWSLDASQPDVSPDGEWILFRSHETSTTEGNVWLVRPDATDAHAVTDSVAGEAKWLSGSFSPDGLSIISSMGPIQDGQQEDVGLYAMRLDGSDLRGVLEDPNFWDSAPEWGPGS
jgi:Tol biopolymer transport system component